MARRFGMPGGSLDDNAWGYSEGDARRTGMQVLIKRSEALFTMRARAGVSPRRKAVAFVLLAAAAGSVAVCGWLWAVELEAAASPPLTGLAARWHVWLGVAVAAGLAGMAAIRPPQRPT